MRSDVLGYTERRTTHQIREQLGMTSEQFAKSLGIPVGTIRNWDARGCAPLYFLNLVHRVIELEGIISEVKEICDKLGSDKQRISVFPSNQVVRDLDEMRSDLEMYRSLFSTYMIISGMDS